MCIQEPTASSQFFESICKMVIHIFVLCGRSTINSSIDHMERKYSNFPRLYLFDQVLGTWHITIRLTRCRMKASISSRRMLGQNPQTQITSPEDLMNLCLSSLVDIYLKGHCIYYAIQSPWLCLGYEVYNGSNISFQPDDKIMTQKYLRMLC